jgi:Putative beta-barrel porin 2
LKDPFGLQHTISDRGAIGRFACWLCWASLGGAAAAHADGTWTPYAAADLEHDTNIFDLPRSGPAPVGNNGPTYGDTFLEGRAGLEGTYQLDQQKFFGTAEFRHFAYRNFTELDHNENLFDGGLKWKLSRVVDGSVEYRHEQRMVQYYELSQTTDLILETENLAKASINLNVSPEWRLETHATDRDLDSPRNDVPGLSLHEESIREGVRYLGVAYLSAGLDAEYLQGRYEHDPTALTPDYHQTSLALAATYILSGLTNFTGTAGYTRRVDPTNAGASGVTGSLSYQHYLSGKTSINVQLSRLLSTYVTTGGNEIDSTAGVMVNYQATYKILIRGGYSYTRSTFPETPIGTTFIDRVDRFQTGNVELTYQILHWLSIRPYARYQTRGSNDPMFSFNGTTVGVELLARNYQPPNR